MKLYATITGEKIKDGFPILVSKGQGSNKYLHIEITDENEEFIGRLNIKFGKDSVGKIIHASIDFAEHVYVNGHHWLDADVSEKKYECKNKDSHGNACYDCESGNGSPCGSTEEIKGNKQKDEKCANTNCNNIRENVSSMFCDSCRFK